tara:strand:+ start:197 stop:643 length:447 start_codon:yes stop_codon:yes gene_type:complete
MKLRDILLSQIYEKESRILPITRFKDEEKIILPRVQIVNLGNDRFEMYNTSSDIYYVMEDWRVMFAHVNGLRELSNSLSYTYKHSELEKTRRKKCSTEEEMERKQVRVENLYSQLADIKKKNPINLNKIKDEYIEKFEESSERRRLRS